MSVEFVFRLVGMVVFALIGVQSIAFFQPDNPSASARYITALTLAGAALGLLVAPYLTTRPYYWVRRKLKQMPASQLVSGVIGLAVGLAVAALLYPSLSALPDPYGNTMPVIISILFGYIGMSIMVMRQRDIFNTIGGRFSAGGSLLNFTARWTRSKHCLFCR